MSTDNICFHGEIRKLSTPFVEQNPYLGYTTRYKPKTAYSAPQLTSIDTLEFISILKIEMFWN